MNMENQGVLDGSIERGTITADAVPMIISRRPPFAGHIEPANTSNKKGSIGGKMIVAKKRPTLNPSLLLVKRKTSSEITPATPTITPVSYSIFWRLRLDTDIFSPDYLCG
jgi:hypothetical protein